MFLALRMARQTALAKVPVKVLALAQAQEELEAASEAMPTEVRTAASEAVWAVCSAVSQEDSVVVLTEVPTAVPTEALVSEVFSAVVPTAVPAEALVAFLVESFPDSAVVPTVAPVEALEDSLVASSLVLAAQPTAAQAEVPTEVSVLEVF
jgi:hypothetical protein